MCAMMQKLRVFSIPMKAALCEPRLHWSIECSVFKRASVEAFRGAANSKIPSSKLQGNSNLEAPITKSTFEICW